jgi:hypothetical protein
LGVGKSNREKKQLRREEFQQLALYANVRDFSHARESSDEKQRKSSVQRTILRQAETPPHPAT